MKRSACWAIWSETGIGRLLGKLARRAVAGDQQIDLARHERMRMLGRKPERARKARAGFDHQQAFRVGAAALQLRHRGACVQREAGAAGGVERRRAGRHHPRRELARDPGEAPEIGRDEAHVVAGLAQRALDRPEEAREQAHSGTREEPVRMREQRREDGQLSPVVALAERVQERRSAGRGRAAPRACRRAGAGRRLPPRCRFFKAGPLLPTARRGAAPPAGGIRVAGRTPPPARTRAIQRRRSPSVRTPCAAPQASTDGPPANNRRR